MKKKKRTWQVFGYYDAAGTFHYYKNWRDD